MAATKKLAQETGITERWLDANVFLDEYLRWEPHRLHHPFLLQWMFAHATATRQKEHDCATHWGCQQPSPKWDVSTEVSAVELVGAKSTQEEMQGVYNEV